MAENKNILTGATEIIPDKAVAVPVQRYDELVKKEALLDKIMEGKELSIYLYQPVKEELNA